MTLADEYDRRDGLGLAELVASGEVHPSELLEEAIARAERVNPRLNAIVTPMYELARKRAKDGLPESGPFRGVPFLLKDLHASYEGVPLKAGSRLYDQHVPSHHAELVRRYEAAGLVVFGRTATPELGVLPTSEAEIYGPTHNPWRLGYSPGGSSGGAAAAVAAGVLPMAHGGDGGGSIRIPASCCGIFGLKPSRLRTPPGPEESEIFFSFGVEHALTRSVRDSAALLDATAGPERGSIYFAPPGGGFLEAISRPPETLRIGYTMEPLLPASPHVEATRAVEAAAALCEELGHHVEPARPSLDGHTFARAFFLHFAVGVASELLRAESMLGRPVTARDVERSTYLLSLVGRSIDAGTFVLQHRILHEQARKAMALFERYDVLLTPTVGLPPRPHGALDPSGFEDALQALVARVGRPELLRMPGLLDRAVDRAYAFAPYTPVFNVTGQPSASVPLHWTEDGMPLGAMITARPGEDARVLRLAAQMEEARPWWDRRPPIRA